MSDEAVRRIECANKNYNINLLDAGLFGGRHLFFYESVAVVNALDDE